MTRAKPSHSHQGPDDPATSARRAAHCVLNAFDTGDHTLDFIINQPFPLLTGLSAADRALLQTLVYGVLRWRGRLDYIIARFSKTPISKIDAPILNILRLGIYQIVYLERIPVSAAVNTSVELAKSGSPGWVVRYVNAVLRNTARKHQSISWPKVSEDSVNALSVLASFPVWMIARWIERLGVKETSQLCDALNTIAPLTIRANTLILNRDQLRRNIASCAPKITPTRVARSGLNLWQPNCKVIDLPGFKQGNFQVQDEAAQLVGELIGPRPGDRVLDACAGRGGKTGHMAQRMRNRGELFAIDYRQDRLKELDQQMQRLGISIVRSIRGDLREVATVPKLGQFDRILVDAPCSGLGVIRRNPDTKWRVQEKQLRLHRKRQIQFLDHLAALVRPSGTLLYAVCSTEPDENEMVVEAFMSRHQRDFQIIPPPPELTARMPGRMSGKSYFRSLPHRHDMDGFFAVQFKRLP